MLAGLILRGVAFEFRNKTERMRWIWDLSFTGGSFAATFIQGLTVGALVEGLPGPTVTMPVATSAGSPLTRCSAASDCVSVMPCLAPVGWSRNVKATSESAAYGLISYLSAGLLIFLIVVFIYSLAEQLEVMDMWFERPYLFVFPVIGAMAAVLLAFSVRYRWDEVPFLMVDSDLLVRLWHLGPLVLAVHDPLCPYHRGSGSAAVQSCIHVLGRGPFRLPANAVLHCD